jgi:succinate dehydrogenase / fumarate reductase flavoprotein subunit
MSRRLGKTIKKGGVANPSFIQIHPTCIPVHEHHQMTTIPGLYVLGKVNFAEHGANRLGASAVMQSLADGYFIIPHTISDYLATLSPDTIGIQPPAFQADEPAVKDRIHHWLNLKGHKTVDEFHQKLGLIILNREYLAAQLF